tara:strand:- start:26 stop:130 length:105 start_codon:yes stop_codon:yes gene_type:complete
MKPKNPKNKIKSNNDECGKNREPNLNVGISNLTL